MAIDIDQSFYKTGTATVANGSTVVTGQGTLWTQTCRAGDLFGTHVGDGTRILSINNNTSITLAYPWQGPSQTAADYEIQFTPYDVGYQASVRKLLTVLASGNIEAFGELIGFEGGVPVFTGAGTMEVINRSEFGPDDIHDNLAELAAIAKQNDQLIIMGDDGSIQLMAISDITDNIATNADNIATNADDIVSLQNGKFNNPTGSTSQFILGDGSITRRGLELIAADTNNNPVAAWVKTDLGTAYRELSLFIDAMPVTGGGALNIHVSEDNGATWLSATSDYTEQALVASGTTITAVQPQSPGIGSGATGSSGGGGGAIMEIKISEFNQFRRSLYSAFITRRTEAGTLELVTRNGLIRPWQPFNAIRLTCSNGNLARFRVVLMGVRG